MRITCLAMPDSPRVSLMVEDCQRLAWACTIAASHYSGSEPAPGNVPAGTDDPDLALFYNALRSLFETLTLYGAAEGRRSDTDLAAIRRAALVDPVIAAKRAGGA